MRERNNLHLVIFVILLALPNKLWAALGGNSLVENTKDNSLVEFLGSIQNWLLGIVGGLSVLFLVYGGFLYITSSGNPKQVEKAKQTLTYAIAGLLLVVLAGLIFEIITGGFLTSIFGNKSL